MALSSQFSVLSSVASSLLRRPVFFITRVYARIRGYAHRSLGVGGGVQPRVKAPGLKLAVAAIIALGFIGFGLAKPAVTVAATSSTINFQAKLENSNGSIANDGNYNVEFKLYNVSTGGSALWTEDYLNSNSQGVRTVNGYLTVNLGSITSFPNTINWSQPLWLTMNIGGTSTGSPTWDGEMSPRLLLTATPYSFASGTAGQLQTTSGSNSTTLSFTTPTATNSILLPNASGTVCLNNSSSCGFASSSGSGNYIQNGTALQAANFFVQAASSGSVAGTLRANGGDALDLQNGAGTVIESFGSTGNVLFQPSANSTTAFQVQNSSGGNIVQVDTSNSAVGVDGASTTAGYAFNVTGSINASSNIYINGSAVCTQSSGCSGAGGGSGVLLAPSSAQADSSTNNSIFINKTGASGNLINLQNNGNSVFTVGNNGTTTISGNSTNTPALTVSRSATTTNADYGTALNYSLNASGNTSSVYQGTNSSTTIQGGSNYTNSISADFGQLTNSSTGTVTMANGSYGTLQNTAGGTITSARGVSGFVTNTGSGTITNASDLYGRTIVASSGTIQNAYGLYLEGNAGSNITNAYGIYQAGASDSNYLAGTLKVANSAVFQDATNSTTAFQIQNAAGSVALSSGTAAGIATPTALTISAATTGGALSAGTYYFALAALSNGGTTPAIASSPASVTTTGSSSSISINWSAVSGATGYALYVSTNGGSTWSALNTGIASGTTSYVFTMGGAFGTLVTLPTVNTTIGTLTVNGIYQIGGLTVLQTPVTTNTFLGVNAGNTSVVGSSNFAVGYSSLSSVTTGGYNIAQGNNSLTSLTTGSYNVAIGSYAANLESTGVYNVAIGAQSLQNATSVSNTAIGAFALNKQTGASYNVALGINAGYTSASNAVTTGSNNTFIGSTSGFGSPLQNANSTALGTNSVVSQSNSVSLGCTNTINGCSATTTVGIGSAGFAPNLLSVGDLAYGTYGTTGTTTTITENGSTITGSGTTFTPSMTGGTIYYNDGTTATVTYVSATSLTSSVNKTVSSGSTYTIVYAGFNVTNSGTAYLQPTTDSATAFQIQTASGTALLVVNTSNQNTTINGAASNTAALTVNRSSSTTSNDDGTDLNDTINPGANSNAVYHNVGATTTLQGSYNYTSTSSSLYGLLANASTGTVTQANGTYGALQNTAGGTVTSGRGTTGFVTNTGAGVITNAIDLYGRTITNTGSGTITNAYGLYLEGNAGSGVTNAYGIYQAGTNDANYLAGATTLAGNLGVGGASTTAGYSLNVTGNLNASNGIYDGGVRVCTNAGCAPISGSNNYIQNSLTTQTANLNVQSANTSNPAAIFQGASGQTADLLDVKNGSGITVQAIGTVGNETLVTSTNATTAFQIQNSSNADLFQADTINSAIGIAGASTTAGYTLNVTGSVNASSNIYINGSAVCTQASGCSTTGGGTTNSGAVYLAPTTAQTDSSSYNSIFVNKTSTTGNLLVLQNNGTNITSISNSGAALFENSANSTAAFQIQNAAGSNLFQADTSNSSIGLLGASTTAGYALNVSGTINASGQIYVGGQAVCTTSSGCGGGGNGYYINNGTSQQTGNFNIQSGVTNSPTGLLEAATNQTADILDLKNSSNSIVYSVSATGSTLFKTSTNSTTGFQVQNAAGAAVLNVDTTNSILKVEQAVSSAATVGSELMSSTTSFSSGWSGTGWTFSSSSATHSSGTTPATYSGFTPVAGTAYQITFTFSGAPGNNTDYITPSIGGAAGLNIYAASDTNETQIITATNTNSLAFTPTSAWTGSITSVSIKVITSYNPALEVLNASGADSLDIRSLNGASGTFVGFQAGMYNTTGGSNSTAFGADALQYETTGSNNTALGQQALQNDTTGSINLAVGDAVLRNNTTGSDNTAVGALWTLLNNTTGSNNTALGYLALLGNQDGSYNTAVGNSAGTNQSYGSYNTFIGTNSGQTTTNILQYASSLGTYSVVNQSNALALGCTTGVSSCTATTTVGIGTGGYAPSLLSVGDLRYSTGTIAESGTTITGSSTAFTSAMTGGTIYYSDGTTATVTYVSGTSLTASASKTVSSGSSYTIVYGGLNVSATGTATLQSTTNSSTAFQVQNASGNNFLQVDTSGANLYLGNPGIASTIQIGNTSGAVAQNIYIGNNATAASSTTITIGSTIGTSLLTLQGGSSGITLAPTASSSTGVLIKPTTASTAAFQVQNTSGNNYIQVDTSGANLYLGNTGIATTLIQIGNSSGAVAQTFKLGANATSGSTSTVTIGSTIGASALTLQSGTGGFLLAPTASSSTGVVVKPGTASTAAFQVQNTSSSSIFDVDTSNGRVGIGTNTPNAVLDIEQNVNSNSTFATHNANAGSSASTGILLQPDTGYGGAIQENSSTNTTYGGANSLNIMNNNAGSLTLGTNSSIQATIASGGATTFKNVTNSAAAFQIQDSGGTALLVANTSADTLTVKTLIISGTLTVNGNATINGHLITANTSGSTTATVNANAGTSATCTVTGNDTGGQVSITTGSGGWAVGDQCDITFSGSYGSAPHPVIARGNATSTNSVQPYVTSSTTGWSINFTAADTAGNTYVFNYFNAQ